MSNPAADMQEHYNRKYSQTDSSRTTIPIVRFPRDRFGATVKWGGTGQRLLEIGAGSGEVIRSLRSNYQEVYGTELSQPRVEAMHEEFKDDKGVQILHHDIERETIPVPDGHFDTVIFVAVVEHLVDPLPPLREIRRVLKPGGRLIIDTPNFAKWTCRIKLLGGYFPSTASKDEGLLLHDHATPTSLYDEGHLHYFTYRSLERVLVERAGFTRTRRHGFGPFGPLCDLWPTLFSNDVFVIATK